MIVDVRLTLDREGRVRVSVEGRRVLVSSGDIADALAQLARAIDAAAWTSQCTQLEVIADAASSLFGARAT